MIRKFKFPRVIILILALTFIVNQNDLSAQNKTGDSKREEIQRYFGYETLMYRYLSIPYDVTMNVNERGDFVHVGFLYLLLIPLLFMIKFRRKKWVAIGMPLLLLLLFIISTSNAFIYDYSANKMLPNNEGSTTYNIESTDGIGTMLLKNIYNINNILYSPFDIIGKRISGDKDFVTYPLVLGLFLLLCYLMLANFKHQSRWYAFLIASLFIIYSFFWYILSAGIIWYGFLSFLLGLVCMVLLLPSSSRKSLDKVAVYSFYSLIGIWIIIGFTSRISNINPNTNPELMGKNMLNPVFLNQLVERIDEDAAINYFYRDFSQVLDKINREEKSLIYRVGTSFTYFIRNNHNRVFLDNQLGFFRNLERRYPNKQTRADILRTNGFKYLIIDLNTPTLDNTPEQSLLDKFNGLIDFVYKNPKVKLLATNRKVKIIENGNVTEKIAYDVFGKVETYGTFAIYEIL